MLVLDTDLPGLGEKPDLEPVNYLAAPHEQERGEAVVLSVAASRQVKLSLPAQGATASFVSAVLYWGCAS